MLATELTFKAWASPLVSEMDIIKKTSIKIEGSNVTTQAKIPNPPTADLISIKHPTTVDIASPREPPMIGIKLLDANLATFIPTSSAETETAFCIVNRPTNTISSSDKIKITVFLIEEIIPPMLKFLFSELTIDKAKKIPIAGVKMFEIINDTICDVKKRFVLYPIELDSPPETAIAAPKTGIKQSIKFPNAFIV